MAGLRPWPRAQTESRATGTAGRGRTIVLTGIKEIDAKLKQLEPRIAKKVIRQAMRKAMGPVKSAVQEIERTGPMATGATAAAVKIRAGKSKKRGLIALQVRIGKGDYQGDQYYAAFGEFGWKTGKRGRMTDSPSVEQNRRLIPGHHRMEQAFNRTKDTARDEAIVLIGEGAEREIAVLGSS